MMAVWEATGQRDRGREACANLRQTTTRLAQINLHSDLWNFYVSRVQHTARMHLQFLRRFVRPSILSVVVRPQTQPVCAPIAALLKASPSALPVRFFSASSTHNTTLNQVAR